MTAHRPRITRVTVPKVHPDPCDVPWAVTPEKIQAAAEGIIEAGHPRKIILFGSAARGRTTRNSDADFLVVVDDEVENTRQESVRLRSAVRDVLMPMDIVVIRESTLLELGQTYGLIYREALEHGIVLYDSAA